MNAHDIGTNQNVDGQFMVLGTKLVQGQKKARLELQLGDATGTLNGVIWDATQEQCTEISGSRYLIVQGYTKEFNGRPQIDVQSYTPVQSVPNPEDYERCAPVPFAELQKRRDTLINLVKDLQLRELLDKILREDTEIADAFNDFPAAKSRHHAYRHGLLYHSIEVASDAYDYGRKLKNRGVDRPIHLDLLLTAGLLHDIGKVLELQHAEGTLNFDYSFHGNLFGHIELGIRVIDEKIRSIPGFDVWTADLLRHMIEAHHGLKAWGSIQEPGFLEAHILHTFDSLSAFSAYFLEAESEAQEGQTFVFTKKMDSDGSAGRRVYTAIGPELLRRGHASN